MTPKRSPAKRNARKKTKPTFDRDVGRLERALDHVGLEVRLRPERAASAEMRSALQRVREIARDARKLAAYDGHSSPPDWRPFVAELADELALVVEALPKKAR